MARPQRGAGSGADASQAPEVASAPQDMSETTNIRIVMRDVAHTATQVERLVDDVRKLGEKVDRVDRSIDRFKVSMIMLGLCLGVFLPVIGGVFWWAVGERINSVLKPTQTTDARPAPVMSDPLKTTAK